MQEHRIKNDPDKIAAAQKERTQKEIMAKKTKLMNAVIAQYAGGSKSSKSHLLSPKNDCSIVFTTDPSAAESEGPSDARSP